MLCHRRDRRWILQSGSLYNSGNHPERLPRIGSATQQPMSVSSAAASPRDEEGDCSCPKRTKPPPLPTALPFPATDANQAALQNWILDRYRSSTFNTCECQTLPPMEGPPLELHVDPEAKPIAVHKPIPVPLHWQQEVKASMDKDVKLGVLEAVPVGEPVTWCHWMVTAPKKNGKPRRTVDMQVLNKHVSLKHITPNPCFTSRRWYIQGPRRRLPMPGTGIIVCQSEKKIATSPRSSRHGVGTDSKLVHRATLLHRTDTPENSTRLPMTSPTKPNASMTYVNRLCAG